MFPRAVAFETRMRSFEPRAPVITNTRLGLEYFTGPNPTSSSSLNFHFSYHCLAQMDSFLAIAVAFLVTLAFSSPVAPLLLASTKPGWSNTGSPRLMYQWNRSFNIPPGQPPGICIFCKSFVQIPPSRGRKAVQMPYHRSISEALYVMTWFM